MGHSSVTTTMVKAPAFLEAVRDLEIGFNIECTASGVIGEHGSIYKEICVFQAPNMSNSTVHSSPVSGIVPFYIRIFRWENDQWYDVRVKNTMNNTWYDNTTGS